MKLGVDLSSYDELQQYNPHFIYKGEEIEPFSFFAKHNHVSMVRLRLWHNPYDNNGQPYGGGTSDYDCFLRLAKKAKQQGMDILLDFHYSDFWVDPSRQKLPKAWETLSYQELLKAVYEYTKETLINIKKEGIDIQAIQVGNEISHGMLWPFGDINLEYSSSNGGGFQGHVELFNQGARACREIFPDAKILCHLEHAGSKDMQDWYISNMLSLGADFDVVGESYYPYWHGPFKDYVDNVTNIINKFKKEVWLVEMGYEFAQSLVEGHQNEYEHLKGEEEFRVGNINGRVPFPNDKQGQADYLKTIIEVSKKAGVSMLFYWEPAWILMENNAWAKSAGQIYCGLEPVKAYNDWANATLFDFEGVANPAIDVFTQEYVDSIK